MAFLKSDPSVMLLSENNSVLKTIISLVRPRSSIADGRSGSFGDDCSKVDGVSDRF